MVSTTVSSWHKDLFFLCLSHYQFTRRSKGAWSCEGEKIVWNIPHFSLNTLVIPITTLMYSTLVRGVYHGLKLAQGSFLFMLEPLSVYEKEQRSLELLRGKGLLKCQCQMINNAVASM